MIRINKIYIRKMDENYKEKTSVYDGTKHKWTEVFVFGFFSIANFNAIFRCMFD